MNIRPRLCVAKENTLDWYYLYCSLLPEDNIALQDPHDELEAALALR